MTAKAKTTAEIQRLITAVARDQFKDAVDSVRVAEGADSEGNPIWHVIVIFDATKAFDQTKASSFVRHIRPKLMEREETFRFPLVSFMSKADAQKLAAA